MLSVCRLGQSQQYKVVLVGDAGVGKSFIIHRLQSTYNQWQAAQEYRPTEGGCAWYYTPTSHDCSLYVLETSGLTDYKELTKLYLKFLDCVVFTFALNDPQSLASLQHWYDIFLEDFSGSEMDVVKFILGTKMDTPHGNKIQKQAAEFAQSIGAELAIASATTGANVSDFFETVSERLSQRKPPLIQVVVDKVQDFIEASTGYCIDDCLLPNALLLSYPDPLLLYSKGDSITSLRVLHKGVAMETEHTSLLWGSPSSEASCKPVLQEVQVKEELPAANPNLLTMCIRKLDPATLWQHEWLELSGGLATTTRRQPTKVTEGNNIVDVKFCTRDTIGRDRGHGLYYMLLQTRDSRLKECGLNPTQIDNSDIIPSPQAPSLTGNPQVSSYSLSCTHAAAVTDSGQAVTWGYSTSGALGIEQHETKHPITVPVPVAVHIDVTQVACGVDFTLLLSRDGMVYSCGSGAFGVLGHADTDNKFIPTKIEALYNIKAIGAGDHHACAIMASGWLYRWGLYTAAGDWTRFRKTPEVVRGIDNVCVTSLSCGAFHTLILTARYAPLLTFWSDYAYSWGLGSSGALGHGDDQSVSRPRCMYKLTKRVKRIAAGRDHSAFLTDDGAVYTCGSNQFGQLGYFTKAHHNNTPTEVQLGRTKSGHNRRARDITCTEHCTMVETEDGEKLVWGNFSYGHCQPDPLPVYDYDVRLIDVATCHLWEGSQGRESCDVILGLTGDSRILICGCISAGMDYQVNPWLEKALAPCSIPGLARLASVGPMLVALDDQGKPYYVDARPWIERVLGQSGLHGELAHGLFSAISQLDVGCLSRMEFKSLGVSDAVIQLETTLYRVVLRTEIGDLLTWAPFTGHPVHLHTELDDQIVVQVACGLDHVVALCDTGQVYTYGEGTHAQLGHGDMRSRWTFEMIPLCRVERFSFVCCGILSTAVQTDTGKVYFWGQLSIPTYERNRSKNHLRDVIASSQSVDPSFPTVSNQEHGRVAWEIDFGERNQGVQLAVIGKTLTFTIRQRNGEQSDADAKPIFRVEAKSIKDGQNIPVKGTVCSTSERQYHGSLSFMYRSLYKVSVTLAGRHVLGSPFKTQVEKGVSLRTCKLALIGCDLESLKSVAFSLRHACAENQDGTGSLIFPDGTARVELWGNPPLNTDQQTANMASLVSVSDGGVFVYVWDGAYSDFPRENLKFWLHWLSVHASSAHVIFLGVKIGAEHVHGVDLKPFQAINSNLRKAIFVGSEPGSLVRELKIVVEERLATDRDPIIWNRLESLEERVREKRDSRTELMDRRSFVRLANECGIDGDIRYRDAALHLEKTGLALHVGCDHVFLVFDQHWMSRQLSDLATSCHRGLVNCASLDEQKSCLVELLIRKCLAFHTADLSRIHIIPCLSPLAEDVWVQEEYSHMVTRHLIINQPPYHVFTAFPVLAASLSRDHHDVTFGLLACVVHGQAFKSRIEAGPCLTDKRKSEVRLIVQSNDRTVSEEIARLTLLALKRYLGESFPEYMPGAVECVSCNKCLQHYLELAVVEDAVTKKAEVEKLKDGEPVVDVVGLRCEGCKTQVLADELLTGYPATGRVIPQFEDAALAQSLVAGIPGSPAGRSNLSSREMLRPVIQQLVETTSKQEKRLMAEIRRQFHDMTRFFMDLKDYDTPRSICLLPDFKSKTSLKGDVLAILKRHLLLAGQKRFRLYLLCEGNGDGTGVHFLEPSKHAGYEVSNVNELLIKCVGHLRGVLQLLIHFAPTWGVVVAMAATYIGSTVPDIFPSEEAVNGILGVAGLSVATLKQVKWTEYFKQVDGFLKDFESSTSSVTQPKQLGKSFAAEMGYKVGGCDYKHLREVLQKLGKKDDYGGLVQEYREDIGAVWVCEKHSRGIARTDQLSIQQHHF